MLSPINHYYLFTESVTKPNEYLVTSKVGSYPPFEATSERTHIVITLCENYVIQNGESLSIIKKPVETYGIACCNNYQDTLLVVTNSVMRTREFFVCEGLKEFNFVILHMYQGPELQLLLNNIRSQASDVKNLITPY